MTLPEIVLWRHLRGKALAHLRFRRQHPVGPYVLDFYCAELRLAVEVEGQVHNNPDRAVHDDMRTHWLAEQGIRVLRLAAADILKDDRLEWALLAIASAPSTAFGGPPPP